MTLFVYLLILSLIGQGLFGEVKVPPKIISSSPNQFHQPLGANVTIFCNAIGSPAPTISWTKDGKKLNKASNSRLTFQNDGSSLLIRNLQERDGGMYKCIFTNAIGQMTQSIHLIVEGQAYITASPSNKTAVLAQRIQFTCRAAAYPNNITHRWYKDSRNVNTLPGYPERIRIVSGDGSLIIERVEKEDMGWYTCRPSNGVGQDPEASAFLNVTYDPVVLRELMPTHVIWAKGFREQLDCPVDANPPVYEFQWTHNGIAIDFRNSNPTLLDNGSLLFELVQDADEGYYLCSAKSAFGRGESHNVQVEVKDPPRFTIRPNVQYIRQPGQEVFLPCAATGTPTPAVLWRKEVGTLEVSPRVQDNNGNLTIYHLKKDDHGVYECEASNEVAKIVTNSELIIQNTTPHAPYNVTVETGLFYATVRWIPSYSSSPQHYLVWFRNLDFESNKWETLMVQPQNTTSFSIHGLEPDTLYEFMVSARNQMGNGTLSKAIRARTLGYVEGIATGFPTDADGSTYIPPILHPIGPRPSPPLNVTARYTSREILVSWALPLSSPAPIFYYKVDYKSGNGDWTPAINILKVPKTSFTFAVNAGDEGKTFIFRVYSFGVLAYSYPSDEVSVTVPGGKPASSSSATNYPSSSDDGFGLSEAEIGGIVGGIGFLLVALSLAIIAVLCSRRRDKHKRSAKYGNVKYLGPADDVDNMRSESTPEWSCPQPQDGRGDSLRYRPHDNGSGVFVIPGSSSLYRGNYLEGLEDPRFYDNRHFLFGPDKGHKVPHLPRDPWSREETLRDPSLRDSYFREPSSRDTTLRGPRSRDNTLRDTSSRDTTLRGPRSRDHSASYIPDNHKVFSSLSQEQRDSPDDDNGFLKDDNGFYPDGDTSSQSREQSRSHPGDRRNRSYHSQDSLPYRPHAFRDVPMASARDNMFGYQNIRTPVVSPVPRRLDRPQLSYQDDSADDVFAPLPKLKHGYPERPGFPRHSSMKPASTYLTDDYLQQTSPQYSLNDISSVLPSSSNLSQNRHPSQSRDWIGSQSHPDSYGFGPPYEQNTPDSFADELENTIIQRDQFRDPRVPQRTLSGEESNSSDSSGRPMTYTRDQLQNALDKVRKGPRAARKGRGPRGSSSELDSISESPIPHSLPRVHSGPSSLPYQRPRDGYPFDPYKGPQDSRGSVSSSGLESTSGRGRGLDSWSHSREDATPDSISSGIGSSRNTSSQLTGSSLHSRPRTGSSSVLPPHEYDTSNGSSIPHDYNSYRKDISGDENYEFDSANAVESDLLEALRNYSQLNNGGEQLLSALQTGLNSSDFLTDLYPKPRKQSRYSDSEERFAKLRSEFHQYRRKQQERQSYPRLGPMDSEML